MHLTTCASHGSAVFSLGAGASAAQVPSLQEMRGTAGTLALPEPTSTPHCVRPRHHPTTQVHLLVRGDKMRASKAMQDRVLANPRVTVHLNTEVGCGGRVVRGGGWGVKAAVGAKPSSRPSPS